VWLNGAGWCRQWWHVYLTRTANVKTRVTSTWLTTPTPNTILLSTPRTSVSVYLYAVMHMHDSVICICSKSAFREKLRQTLTDPNNFSQAYVDRSQIWRVKMLATWARALNEKGEKGEKGGCFVTGTMKLFFFVTDQIVMKSGKKSICVLYWTLIEEFLNFPLRGDFSPNAIFLVAWTGLRVRPTGQGLRFYKEGSSLCQHESTFCATYRFGCRSL